MSRPDVQAKVEEVKQVMAMNVQAAINRGENLDSLMGRSEELHTQASAFQKQGQQLRRRMWWENIRCKAITACGVLLVVFVIFLAACFGGATKCIGGKGGASALAANGTDATLAGGAAPDMRAGEVPPSPDGAASASPAPPPPDSSLGTYTAPSDLAAAISDATPGYESTPQSVPEPTTSQDSGTTSTDGTSGDGTSGQPAPDQGASSDSSFVPSDGSAPPPSDGSAQAPDGSSAATDSSFAPSDGSAQAPDGSSATTDSSFAPSDGSAQAPDGSSAATDSSFAPSDGSAQAPDGFSTPADQTAGSDFSTNPEQQGDQPAGQTSSDVPPSSDAGVEVPVTPEPPPNDFSSPSDGSSSALGRR